MTRIGAVAAGGLIVLSGLAVLGCGDDAWAPSPWSRATALAISTGDGQSGVTGFQLTFPLVIRARDARGNGVPGVEVWWEVRPGAGFFHSFRAPAVRTARTFTGDDGKVGVLFTPWSPGTLAVTAEAIGLEGSPVTFTVEAEHPGWWPAPGTGSIYERLLTGGAQQQPDRYVLDDAGGFGLQRLGHPIFGTYSIEGEWIYFLFPGTGTGTGIFRADSLFVSYEDEMLFNGFQPGVYLRAPREEEGR